jgi:hypothetical protein
MLDYVCQVLAWKDATFLLSYLHKHHRDLLSSKFQEVLDGFGWSSVGRRLPEVVSDLPEASLTRMLTAPETMSYLVYGRSNALSFYLNAAQAERYLIGGVQSVPEPLWTALGDTYIPAGRYDPTHTDNGAVAPWTPNRPWRAPRLPNGTPVDFVSPFALTAYGYTPPGYRALEPADQKKVMTKLTQAWQGITSISPEASALLSSMIRVIVVHADAGSFEHFSSYSCERWIGRIGLANAHCAPFDVVTLADGLVHEAIHSLIYLVEEQYPLLTDRRGGDSVTVISPWSGRQLYLHSFAHACFVWYGLWKFWQVALTRSVFRSDRVLEMMNQSGKGFADPRFSVSFAAADPYLSDQGRLIGSLAYDLVHAGAR